MRFQIWTTLLLALLVTAGCSSDRDKVTDPPEEGPYLANNTEGNVLVNLIRAYRAKDIDAYLELFDLGQFTFVFDEIDVANDPDMPPTWGWQLELDAARKIFESPLVLEVKLDFVREKTQNAVAADSVSLEWTKVIVTNIQLEIDTTDPLGGENIIYKVSGDRATFFFQSYPDELIDGQPRKRIVEWRDERIGFLRSILESSWGEIKWAWR